MREAAERILTATLEPERARELLLAAEDLETSNRLARIHRAAVIRCIGRVLPDDRPYWPDVDATGWPMDGDGWASRLEPWPELRRFSSDEHHERMRGVEWHHRGPYWTDFRSRTKSRLVLYVIRTGDWEYARNIVAAAHPHHLERNNDPQLIVRGLLWSRPDLLKPTLSPSPAFSRN